MTDRSLPPGPPSCEADTQRVAPWPKAHVGTQITHGSERPGHPVLAPRVLYLCLWPCSDSWLSSCPVARAWDLPWNIQLDIALHKLPAPRRRCGPPASVAVRTVGLGPLL